MRNAGIGWVEGSVVGFASLFGLDPVSLEFTADAGAAWSALGMTAAGLVLFISPAGWALQSSLAGMKSDGVELPAPLRAVDDFVNGAGDQVAAAVSGFFQVDTWISDPGKAATTFGLNAASVLMPTGAGGAALKGVASTVKVAVIVEKLEAIGTKIGGPTGDAFTAGVRAAAAGSVEALNAVKTILDAPDILAREAATAARKALADIADHMPTFTPSLAGIDNGHLNNESAESATSGAGGSSGSSSGSGADRGGSSSTGYDPNNYNPDGTVKDPEFGVISPERRTELLRQRAEHDVEVLDAHPTHTPSDVPGDGKPGDGTDHDAANPGSDWSSGEPHSGPDSADGHHDGGDEDGTTPEDAGDSAPFSHPSPRVTEANGIIYLDGQPKMTVVEFQKILDSSVHNPNAPEIMLGKFDGGAPDNYINRAKEGGYSYFDLGPEWDKIAKKFVLDDTQMFELFNSPFLDDAMAARKPVHFSHDPRNDQLSLGDELRYLTGDDKYSYDPITMTANPR